MKPHAVHRSVLQKTSVCAILGPKGLQPEPFFDVVCDGHDLIETTLRFAPRCTRVLESKRADWVSCKQKKLICKNKTKTELLV